MRGGGDSAVTSHSHPAPPPRPPIPPSQPPTHGHGGRNGGGASRALARQGRQQAPATSGASRTLITEPSLDGDVIAAARGQAGKGPDVIPDDRYELVSDGRGDDGSVGQVSHLRSSSGEIEVNPSHNNNGVILSKATRARIAKSKADLPTPSTHPPQGLTDVHQERRSATQLADARSSAPEPSQAPGRRAPSVGLAISTPTSATQIVTGQQQRAALPPKEPLKNVTASARNTKVSRRIRARRAMGDAGKTRLSASKPPIIDVESERVRLAGRSKTFIVERQHELLNNDNNNVLLSSSSTRVILSSTGNNNSKKFEIPARIGIEGKQRMIGPNPESSPERPVAFKVLAKNGYPREAPNKLTAAAPPPRDPAYQRLDPRHTGNPEAERDRLWETNLGRVRAGARNPAPSQTGLPPRPKSAGQLRYYDSEGSEESSLDGEIEIVDIDKELENDLETSLYWPQTMLPVTVPEVLVNGSTSTSIGSNHSYSTSKGSNSSYNSGLDSKTERAHNSYLNNSPPLGVATVTDKVDQSHHDALSRPLHQKHPHQLLIFQQQQPNEMAGRPRGRQRHGSGESDLSAFSDTPVTCTATTSTTALQHTTQQQGRRKRFLSEPEIPISKESSKRHPRSRDREVPEPGLEPGLSLFQRSGLERASDAGHSREPGLHQNHDRWQFKGRGQGLGKGPGQSQAVDPELLQDLGRWQFPAQEQGQGLGTGQGQADYGASGRAARLEESGPLMTSSTSTSSTDRASRERLYAEAMERVLSRYSEMGLGLDDLSGGGRVRSSSRYPTGAEGNKNGATSTKRGAGHVPPPRKLKPILKASKNDGSSPPFR